MPYLKKLIAYQRLIDGMKLWLSLRLVCKSRDLHVTEVKPGMEQHSGQQQNTQGTAAPSLCYLYK